MEIFIIDELKQTVKGLSSVQCDFLSENCIVALENNGHISGCMLNLIGDIKKIEYKISWGKKVNKAGYKEIKKIIEHAAEAISFFLNSHITPFSIIEEARIGTRIDYWLGYDESHHLYDAKNFFQARLEISGIDIESPTNTLEKRTKEKKERLLKSKSKLPAYVSVVEFSSPKAFFGKK